MIWTKVTDALPPDGRQVLVTVKYEDGQKEVWENVRWNRIDHRWEWLKEPMVAYWEPMIAGKPCRMDGKSRWRGGNTFWLTATTAPRSCRGEDYG